MMKKLLLSALLCAGIIGAAEPLIPEGDYKFNEFYTPKKVAGRYGWLNGLEYNGSLTIMEMFDEIENLAMFGVDPDPIKSTRGKLLESEIPLLKKRMELFRQQKLPMVGAMYDRSFNKRPLPAEQELAELAKNPCFLGVRGFNEWGTNLDRILMIGFRQDQIKEAATRRRIPLFKDFFPADMKDPATREEYAEAARYTWLKMNAPFKGQVHALSGSQCWALSWSGGWEPIRAIINENRTPYRNNFIFNALTRGSGRMWQIPYGFLMAFDWNCRISHPALSHIQKPSPGYYKQQGILRITPSLYRRIWYYMALSNAAVLLDESDHMRYADWSGSGQFRLSWYGELCSEIHEFQKLNPDTGINYNPVGLLLSWHNGWAYRGSMAFNRFPYNNGEHMTRELINTLLFNFSEKRELPAYFGATPYGDLYDILRLDTPKGVLPPELLTNYKVLFLVGEHRLDAAAVAGLQDYVRQGGTLIVNGVQLSKFDTGFTGVKSGKTATFTEMSDMSGKKFKSAAFDASILELHGASPLYVSGKNCLGAVNNYGKGKVITIGAHWLLENGQTEVGSDVRKKLLPVAADLMEKILPSLTPFKLEGSGIKEQLAWQVNRKADNWILAIYNNGGINEPSPHHPFYNGPEEFDISKTVRCRVRVSKELTEAVNLLSGEKCYFSDDKEGRFLEVEITPGDQVILEFSGKDIPPRRVTEKVNLALKKPVTASGFFKNFEPAKAVDGDTGFASAWYSKDAAPQKLTVDLGKVQKVSALRVIPAWSVDNRYFPRITQFVVKSSCDGKNYQLIMDESRNIMPDTPKGVFRKITPIMARYLQIEVLFNSSRQGGQIVEFQVFGDETQTIELPWKRNPSMERFPAKILQMTTMKNLTEITPAAVKQDEKPLGIDRECLTGSPLSVRRQKYTRGFGCHANSEIVFKLSEKDNWKFFTTRCAIDDQGTNSGSVSFKIYTDGKLAADSGKVTISDHSIPLWADLTGVKELKLVVTDCGDGIAGDIADWLEPALRK